MYQMEEHFFKELKVSYNNYFGNISDIKELFPSGWWAVILLHSGSIKLADGDRISWLNGGQLFSLTPSAKFKKIKEPVKMSIVSYSAEFAYSSLLVKSYRSYLDYIFTTLPIHLIISKENQVRMSKHYRLLAEGILTGGMSVFRKELILLHYNLLLFDFSVLASDHCQAIMSGGKRKEILFLNFISLLQANCKREHTVKFYADSLCITTGYLTKAIREMGGRSAKHFIEMAVISEAYILLGDQKLTIAEIADELAFSGTSTFSTFFKKIAMISPRAYRESIFQNKL